MSYSVHHAEYRPLKCDLQVPERYQGEPTLPSRFARIGPANRTCHTPAAECLDG